MATEENQVPAPTGEVVDASSSEQAEAGSSEVRLPELFFVKLVYKGKAIVPLMELPKVGTMVQDIKLSMFEHMGNVDLTCISFELEGQPLYLFTQLETLPLSSNPQEPTELQVVEELYDDASARFHVKQLYERMMARDEYGQSLNTPGSASLTPASIRGGSPSVLRIVEQIADHGAVGENADTFLSKLYPSQKSGSSGSSGSSGKGGKKGGKKGKKGGKKSKAVESNNASSLERAADNVFIGMSGYNPPPASRALAGDLFYLEVRVPEAILHVTASPMGFFINESTRIEFNASPKGSGRGCGTFFSLAELLCAASNSFEKVYKGRMAQFSSATLEHMETPYPCNTWAVRVMPHVYDPTRADSHLTKNMDSFTTGQARDWNEEFQVLRAQSKAFQSGSLESKLMFRSLYSRLMSEYVEAATLGAKSIILNLDSMAPLNPSEPPSAHLFLKGNVFYTIPGRHVAPTAEELVKDLPDVDAAINDLGGVDAVASLEVDGLHTVATAVIKFRGYTVVAQSIIPGVFHRDQLSTLLCGSVEGHKDLQWRDEDFISKMKKVADGLHIAERTVVDGNGAEVTLAASVDSKGIKGTDNRYYVIDLGSVFPRDTNWLDSAAENTHIVHSQTVVSMYLTMLAHDARTKHQEEFKAAVEQIMEADSVEAKDIAEDDERLPKFVPPETPSFNINLHHGIAMGGEDAEAVAEADGKVLDEIAGFVNNLLLPKIVTDLLSMDHMPSSNKTLAALVARYGLSPRYLGKIRAALPEQHVLMAHLITSEMVVVCAAHLFLLLLRDVPSHLVSTASAHFLNCLFAAPGTTVETPALLTKSLSTVLHRITNRIAAEPSKDDEPAADPASFVTMCSLTREQLWSLIEGRASHYFGVDLFGEPFASLAKILWTGNWTVPALSSFCGHTGLQINVDASIQLTGPQPESGKTAGLFTADAIVDLQPIVLFNELSMESMQTMLDNARIRLLSGQVELALILVNQAHHLIVSQLGTSLHKDVAECHRLLAVIKSSIGDIGAAVEHGRSAVIIAERVTGLDSHYTSMCYRVLGSILLSQNKPALAHKYLSRALEISEISSTFPSFDLGEIARNLGNVYLKLGKPELALHHFNADYNIIVRFLGHNSSHAIQPLANLAQAQLDLGNTQHAIKLLQVRYATILQAKGKDSDLLAPALEQIKVLAKGADGVDAAVDTPAEQQQ